jgi:Lhr-like helicase
MINPSNEQLEVINAIKDGYNVQVDAVAGSGKTTTVLSLAHYNSTKIIIQITYNSELKTEVRNKREKFKKTMDLENLEIHTYHSFATTYYSLDAKTDIGLESILEESMTPKIQLPDIEILVIDEIQDMNELYYRFVLKIMKDTHNYKTKMLIN